MPIYLKNDSKGDYYQYNETGAKYYFKTLAGQKRAYNKALRQMRSIKEKEKHKGNDNYDFNDNILRID